MTIIFGDCKRLLDLRMFLEHGIVLAQEPRENGCCSSPLNQDVAITGLACITTTCLKSIWQTLLGWTQLGSVARSKTNRPSGSCLFIFRCDWRCQLHSL